MPMHNFTIRLPDELREKLEREARKDGRSLSNLIVRILDEHVSSKKERM